MWSARDNAVYWVDILTPALNRLSLADGSVERWTMPEPLGWVVENEDGQLVGGFQSGFGRISLDRMTVTHIAGSEPDLPAQRVTNITFAGDALDRMFVTSAAKGLPESEYDGALFEVTSGVVGLASGIYQG